MLAVQDLSSFPAEFTPYEDDVVFAAQDSAGYEPWKYNGSVATRIADINPAGSSFPSEFTVVGSNLYFSASAGNNEFRLWKYDGATVSMVLDISGMAPREPSNLVHANGLLFFVADDGTHGPELWRSNGTAAGTEMVKEIFPGDTTLSGPDQLTAVNNTLYFTAYEHLTGW
ncbi:MAG TPA: ELWxxDGT repeat protein, partial [Pirellulaceae bacterium]